MFAYCLFCRTQRCSRIARLLEIRGVDRAFSPKILSKQRKEGVNVPVERDLLPGYVFLFNEERLMDFTVFAGIDGISRRVGKTEDGTHLVCTRTVRSGETVTYWFGSCWSKGSISTSAKWFHLTGNLLR